MKIITFASKNIELLKSKTIKTIKKSPIQATYHHLHE